jgi:hypothetical protein
MFTYIVVIVKPFRNDALPVKPLSRNSSLIVGAVCPIYVKVLRFPPLLGTTTWEIFSVVA